MLTKINWLMSFPAILVVLFIVLTRFVPCYYGTMHDQQDGDVYSAQLFDAIQSGHGSFEAPRSVWPTWAQR